MTLYRNMSAGEAGYILPRVTTVLAACAIVVIIITWFISRKESVDDSMGTEPVTSEGVGTFGAQPREGETGGQPARHQSVAANERHIREPGPESFRPAALYEKYSAAAIEGDLNAQYVLMTALGECRSVARGESDLEKLARAGIDQDVVRAARERYERCRPLLAKVPDIESEYNRWQRLVTNAGHILLMAKQQGMPAEQRLLLIKRAIAGPYPEPHLYAEAYLDAARFYSNYPEHLDPMREEAWLLLYCAKSYHCNSDAERSRVGQKYHSHEYKEIAALETSLRQAIERREWHALGF
jgi:hypothetical protein